MFKQIIMHSLIGVGLLCAAPVMAHSQHDYHSHQFQIITPIIKPAPQPVRHCVSGKHINKMQASQKSRIQRGKRQGRLVRWEVRQLKQQQRHIKQAEQRMRNSQHCLTKQEANQLTKRLRRADRNIRQLKHNNVRVHYGQQRHYHRH